MSDILHERTTLRVILTAIAAAAVGVALLTLAANLESYPTVESIIREIGSLLIVSVALAFLWELAVKRAFVAELLSISGLVESIQRTGVTGLASSWQKDIPWTEMFKTAKTVDMFLAYGINWRGFIADDLAAFAKRPNTSCRILLPDVDDPAVVSALALMFQRPPKQIRDRVLEATEEFQTRLKATKCEIWWTKRPPVFAFYLIGDAAVVTLYRYTSEITRLIGFTVRQGAYYDFLKAEFDGIIASNTTRQIYPPIELDTGS